VNIGWFSDETEELGFFWGFFFYFFFCNKEEGITGKTRTRRKKKSEKESKVRFFEKKRKIKIQTKFSENEILSLKLKFSKLNNARTRTKYGGVYIDLKKSCKNIKYLLVKNIICIKNNI
jgi:hypothetical protein